VEYPIFLFSCTLVSAREKENVVVLLSTHSCVDTRVWSTHSCVDTRVWSVWTAKLLHWTTSTHLMNFMIFFDFSILDFFLANVLSGNPNTSFIEEGDPWYFSTLL